MSMPPVPPRPSRTSVKQEMPHIPARPIRKTDPSPARDDTTRSPFNVLPNSNGSAFAPPSGLKVAQDEPRRPSSMVLPSHVGDEGIEYSSYDQLPAEAHTAGKTGSSDPAAPEQTKNVSADMPLHQPKASVPQSTATSRISTVTSTDSTSAAAAGIGMSQPDDDVHNDPLSRTTSRTHDDYHRRAPSTDFGRSSSSLQNGRPSSMHSQDHHEDIPRIGQQIPLYPNAGDVQAPSPAPTQSQFTQGIGFFNDGGARNHNRRRSKQQEFGPEGSYGLHHGSQEYQDQFEKAWIAKHPNEASKEGYHPYMLRPETALSSDQLNRIVSNEPDIGMGTSASAIGTPTWDFASQATQVYTSRANSAAPSPAALPEPSLRRVASRDQHNPSVESPLKQSFPLDATSQDRDTSEDEVYHLDPPARYADKVTGGGPADNTIDLGPKGGNSEMQGGWYVETGEGIPILASDELQKRPGSAFMQPAVDPEDGTHLDDYYDSDDYGGRRSSLRATSRPSSRPGSVHGGYQGGPLHRFISHEEHHGSGMGTPLEEIEEYEPLFPEDEKDGDKPRSFKKRPDVARHHFPSQDVWEDTPNSLQYQATVQTPEPPAEARPPPAENVEPGKVFETPEQEEARKTQNPADMLSDSKTFAKPHFKAGVMDDAQGGRPGVQRFPSSDIWEDTPDSMRLVTTVSSPQMDEIKSPPEDRPTTTALPHSQDDGDARSTTGYTGLHRPSIPARPQRRSGLAQEVKPDEDPREKEVPDLGTNEEQVLDRTKPSIPDRPKPSVPARPARPSSSEQSDGASLTKSVSGASDEGVTSPPERKAKPAVPARPAGSKIAALQGGFMNDLNKRLQLGPQAPPKAAEPEAAVNDAPREPLADARKSRAKGPARRKPASAIESSGFSFCSPMTLWQIDETDELKVASSESNAAATESAVEPEQEVTADTHAQLEKVLSQNEETNTEEPPVHTKSGSMSDDQPALSAQPREAIGAEGDKPLSGVSELTAEQQKEVQPEMRESLAEAEEVQARDEQESIVS
ncbi:hypothetical protein LTR62_004190 [Meristemomyces frigidus]|uniref:Altered inheritance of mitochondria protein 21 n=1 Tax=Meristemomyces frigidus TaxID=1508187 RepID=A0AAN7YKN8_9PEZI|nr:hypothetical protein LTR62_004190 [Meristemomyces frigidus]